MVGGPATPMNGYVILALDGLLYLACFALLVGLTEGCARLLSRGHVRAGAMAAVLTVFVVGVGKNLIDGRIGAWLPNVGPYVQLGEGAAAVFLLAVVVVRWRYSLSALGSVGTAVVLVLAIHGAVAETIPVTGFLSGGDRGRVALGNRSLGLGEVYTVSRGSRIYVFRMEAFSDGALHVAETSGAK